MIEIGLDLSIMKYQQMKHPSIHVQAKKFFFDGATIVMQLESVFTVNLIKARCTLLFPDDLFS